MRRLRPRCAAMNAMEWGILRENAQTGLKAEPKLRIRQGGKYRRSVRIARGPQMASPHDSARWEAKDSGNGDEA
jgi:hypothetical protein